MPRIPTVALLFAILLISLLLRAPNLGAPSLHPWDESYHALVAKNLLLHPLTPTLINSPAVKWGTVDGIADWRTSNIWFHKGIVPEWIAALSMGLLGKTTLGYRVASLMLGLGCVVLMFFLGTRLFNHRVGAVAALLCGINPFFTAQIHGIAMADVVDTSLLFFTLSGLLAFARAIGNGRTADFVLTGVAAALAVMSKYFLGLLVPAVVFLTAVFHSPSRLILRRPRPWLLMMAGFMTIVVPWVAYYQLRFPSSLSNEIAYYFGHFRGTAEGWAAPWDRFLFDYLPNGARDAFVPGLAAIAILLFAVRDRRERFGVVVVGVWAVAAILPHLLAHGKVPSYATLATPALILLAVKLVDEGLIGNPVALAYGTAAMIASLLAPSLFPKAIEWGKSYPVSDWAILGEKPWIWIQAAIIAAGGTALFASLGPISRQRWAPMFQRLLGIVCIVGAVVIMARQARDTIKVTGMHEPASRVLALAERIRKTDASSVFFIEPDVIWHAELMFYAGRTAYPTLPPDDVILRITDPHRPVFAVTSAGRQGAEQISPGLFLSRLR